LLKGWRALETGGDTLPEPATSEEMEALQLTLREPSPDRLRDLFRALAGGQLPDVIAELTGIDPWFLHQVPRHTDLDRALRGARWDDGLVRRAKRLGFSDRHLAARLGLRETEVRRHRLNAGIRPVMKAVDTCGAEFQAETPYFYSTYEDECEVPEPAR